jgi:starvation-inducible outer membrane lipoprotein
MPDNKENKKLRMMADKMTQGKVHVCQFTRFGGHVITMVTGKASRDLMGRI